MVSYLIKKLISESFGSFEDMISVEPELTFKQMSDVFEKRDSCVYSYDFGDDWEHVITVEERINEGGSTGFRLLEMQGERPPEDVGGEDGFEEYLRIISDENDPEHESTLQWAELTKAESKTIEEINRKMETII